MNSTQKTYVKDLDSMSDEVNFCATTENETLPFRMTHANKNLGQSFKKFEN